jgi:hypothetical protein
VRRCTGGELRRVLGREACNARGVIELRVYVKELENRMPLMHALDMALHEAFREHDINIRIPPG